MQLLNRSGSALCKQLVIYCLGLFLMALGVSFSVQSDLGVSPVNSIPYVLSEIFRTDMGIWTIAVYTVYILIQLLILRRAFHPARLLQLVCTFLFGWFVDLTNLLTETLLPLPANYFVRLIYLFISIALVALGILFYLSPSLLSLPGEGVMQTISEKFNLPLHRVKMIFDCTVSIIALILSLLVFHTFHGVREGTVIAAIGVGRCLGFYTRRFQAPLLRFLELVPEEDLPEAPEDAEYSIS